MNRRDHFRHIFFITDVEGVAGVTDWTQTRGAGPRCRVARHLLTKEINAVVEGLFLKAAELSLLPRFKVSVWDGHGSGGIVFEDLDARVEKFRQFHERDLHRLLTCALNDDPPMDALGFIGQHAMAGTGGSLCHTYNSRTVKKYLLNGVEIGEFGTRALHAWTLGIPTVFLSGDDVACKEASGFVPGIVQVAVKKSQGVLEAESLSPADSARTLLEQAGKILDLEPYSLSLSPRFHPEPPYVYEKVRRKRWGVLPRRNQTVRGDDLCDVLRGV